MTEIELEEKKRNEVIEIIVSPPSRRVNFTLTPHPDKEELILFGGEYCNGLKVKFTHTDINMDLDKFLMYKIDNIC